MRHPRSRMHVFILLLVSLSLFPGNPVEAAQQAIAVPLAGNQNFIRGDTNIDLSVDIADAVAVLGFLFPSGPPTTLACDDAADSNDDESIDVADAIYLLNFLFAMAAPPPAPHPDCGADSPTTSTTPINQLGCLNYPSCVDDNDPDLVAHVLRRAAFGPTPALQASVELIGAEAWIQQQLNDQVDDVTNTRLNNLLAGLNSGTSYVDLQKAIFARAWLSRQQLREQMTDFWDNHFNTYFWNIRGFFRSLPSYTNAEAEALTTQLEGDENQAFRDLAFGPFHELLLASATGVTMLKYLDSNLNVAIEPNENYAHELFELHTHGDDNGYDQVDIEEMARCLTGWTFCKKDPSALLQPLNVRALLPCLPDDDPFGVWTFHFDTATHDYGAKTLTLGSTTIVVPARPAGDPLGILDALNVIQYMATNSPQTAEFISTKLIRKFITDDPGALSSLGVQSLLADCISTWLASDGDIKDVLEVILTSAPFLDQAGPYRWNLVETPYEYLMATARVLDDGSMTPADEATMLNRMRTYMSRLGNLPFYWFTPDGYPDLSSDQLGTSKVLDRIKFNNVIFNGGTSDPEFDLVGFLNANSVPPEDPAAIVDFLLETLFQSGSTAEDRQLAIDFLSTDLSNPPQPSTLLVSSSDYENRIQRLVAFLAAFPQNLKQ